jgi:hypothetical protein
LALDLIDDAVRRGGAFDVAFRLLTAKTDGVLFEVTVIDCFRRLFDTLANSCSCVVVDCRMRQCRSASNRRLARTVRFEISLLQPSSSASYSFDHVTQLLIAARCTSQGVVAQLSLYVGNKSAGVPLPFALAVGGSAPGADNDLVAIGSLCLFVLFSLFCSMIAHRCLTLLPLMQALFRRRPSAQRRRPRAVNRRDVDYFATISYLSNRVPCVCRRHYFLILSVAANAATLSVAPMTQAQIVLGNVSYANAIHSLHLPGVLCCPSKLIFALSQCTATVQRAATVHNHVCRQSIRYKSKPKIDHVVKMSIVCWFVFCAVRAAIRLRCARRSCRRK